MAKQAAGIVEFVIEDNGINRCVDLRLELMSVLAQLAYVIDAVANSGTGAELGRTDVDSIGSVVDGRYPVFQVLGRCQQLEWFHVGDD